MTMGGIHAGNAGTVYQTSSRLPGGEKARLRSCSDPPQDTELTFGFRIRLVLGSNGTRIQAFDQDVWATNLRYERQDPRGSFDAYSAQREHNLRRKKG
jgi:hypothetical protein